MSADKLLSIYVILFIDLDISKISTQYPKRKPSIKWFSTHNNAEVLNSDELADVLQPYRLNGGGRQN